MQIFICGDSTAASYDPETTQMVGWGQLLENELPGISVINLAMAGRSTRTFLEENRLQPVTERARPGDMVLVQFAHNDENEKKPERYTAPWTDYTDNLSFFVRFARERNTVPVLLTPVCMRVWKDGALQPTHGEYPDAMRSVARLLNVPLIDLYTESFRIVSELGEEKSSLLFMPEDIAHTRRAGAECFAAAAARELKALQLVPSAADSL